MNQSRARKLNANYKTTLTSRSTLDRPMLPTKVTHSLLLYIKMIYYKAVDKDIAHKLSGLAKHTIIKHDNHNLDMWNVDQGRLE